MPEVVTCRSVTYINNKTAASLTQEEIDLDTCYEDNEIVIHVHAAAFNPVDLLSQGFMCSYLVSSRPKSYGRDYSRVIVRRGKNVDEKWQIGDKVNGAQAFLVGQSGSMSDYLVLNPSKQCSISHMKPINQDIQGKYDEFTFDAAWPLVFCTAFGILTNYGQKFGPDSRILVIGASTAVSNAFVQIAKNYMNVGTVVGVCSSKSVEYNKKLGFDYLATYDEGPLIESVAKVFLRDLQKEKFDLIFDSVGNNDFFPVLDKFLKPRSQNSYYITIVGDGKLKYGSFSAMGTFWMASRILNPFRSYNYKFGLFSPSERAMEIGNKLISEGKYKPAIDSVHPIEDFKEAIDRLSSSRAKGKVVLKINN